MVLSLRQGQPALAEQLALQILQIHPDEVLALQVLSQARLAQGRHEDAIAGLEAIIDHHGDPGLASLYARALNAAGRQGEAVAFLTKATERLPPNPELFLELANMTSHARGWADGMKVLRRGLHLMPNDPALEIGLGYLHLRLNELTEALALFQGVHERVPQRHDGLIALATALAQDGDFERAADLFSQALGIRPNDPITQINLGRCLLESGKRLEGEAALRVAARDSKLVAGRAIMTLAHASHGRFFLNTGAALGFLRLTDSE
jgi:predicted Zn-dependent protease